MSILKVGTIQDQSNSNTAISIDNSGRVNIPKIPAFHVRGYGTFSSSVSPTVNGVTVGSSYDVIYNMII